MNGMPTCPICCIEKTKLHLVCHVCTGGDKATCSECLARQLRFDGLDLNADSFKTTLKCAWCNGRVPESRIQSTSFSTSLDFYRTTSRAYAVAIKALINDRTNQRDIINEFERWSIKSLSAARSTHAWMTHRSLRPSTLSAQSQEDFNAFASTIASRPEYHNFPYL